eukprot:6536298-Alexandrium_andersonii.AAC.1
MPTVGRRPGDGPCARHANRAHCPPQLALRSMAVVRQEASPERVSALLVQVWAQCTSCPLQGLHFGHRCEGHELQRGRCVVAAQPLR